MQDNRLSIQVKVPVAELFAYTVSPWNAHLWMEDVVAEECSYWPPQPGVSHYRTKGHDGVWRSYLLSAFEPEHMFELSKPDGSFVARYTYRDIGNGISELDYFESVGQGDIVRPFSQESLDNLKRVLEAKPLF